MKIPVEQIGDGLVRPECVLATKSGDIFVSDFRGGVTRIKPTGEQISYLGSYPGFGKLQTNGFAIESNESFLIAHLGETQGGIFRLNVSGEVTPYLLEIDGLPLPPANFVHIDHQERVWITVSTRLMPRFKAYNDTVADGFIILVDKEGPRIVADNIGYANECCVSPDGRKLFVNATFGRECIAFDITEKNELSNRRVHTTFGPGTFPDGLCFDNDGCLLVTSIVSNRIIRVDPAGEQTLLFESCCPEFVDSIERKYQSRTMGKSDLTENPDSIKNISSLTFAGSDLNQTIAGCLLNTEVYRINLGLAGIPPHHWHYSFS